MKCPKCKKEIKEVFEVHGTLKTFCAVSPLEGLSAYGPYDAKKDLICEVDYPKDRTKIVHIVFPWGEKDEDRLIVHYEDYEESPGWSR